MLLIFALPWLLREKKNMKTTRLTVIKHNLRWTDLRSESFFDFDEDFPWLAAYRPNCSKPSRIFPSYLFVRERQCFRWRCPNIAQVLLLLWHRVLMSILHFFSFSKNNEKNRFWNSKIYCSLCATHAYSVNRKWNVDVTRDDGTRLFMFSFLDLQLFIIINFFFSILRIKSESNLQCVRRFSTPDVNPNSVVKSLQTFPTPPHPIFFSYDNSNTTYANILANKYI